MTTATAHRPLALATPLSGTRVLGVGAAQPTRTVTAAELGAPFGRDADWIRARTGIETVRRAAPGDAIELLAAQAAARALSQAALAADDVDLVMTASCSLEHNAVARIAATAAPHAGWMAVNAACSGFCFATSTADNLIRTGAARHVLVVAVERMSALLDPTDLGTSIIFGDGAGAAVFGPASLDEHGIGPVAWGSDGARSDLIACDADGLLRMAGQEVFRWAIASMPAIARDACTKAGVGIDDIEVFVPHQANARIVDAITTKLGLTHAVVARDIICSGNTSAASIPIALARLLEREPGLSGKLALLLGFGAGLSYAGQVIQLP